MKNEEMVHSPRTSSDDGILALKATAGPVWSRDASHVEWSESSKINRVNEVST
jgi:hypothetical protein